MTVEQEVFRRMRFDKDKMEDGGFVKKGDRWKLNTDFMNGDFIAEITVMENGDVSGKVTDKMNDEEYAPLRVPHFSGAYVNSVRDAYEKLLRDIAARCCVRVTFDSDQCNRIADDILGLFGTEPDFPWESGRYKDCGVFRHKDSKKWFAIVMNIDRRLLDKEKEKESSVNENVDVMNLKIDERKKDELLSRSGIYRAYHMNHDKWISLTLDDLLTDKEIIDLVEESYQLTKGAAGIMDESLIKQVLSIADSIPEGHVASYGKIAELAGRPKNARLVGKIMSMADRYGDHPCHRVVNHAGRTVPGWKEQRAMLEAEGVEFKPNGCVDMKRFQI